MPRSPGRRAQVLDEGVAGDDHPGGTVSLQSSHGSKPGFEPSMVGLERVVCMDLGVMERGREQLVEDPGVDPVPVGGDLHGCGPSSIERPREEPAGGFGVAARRQVHVDDLAELVDSSDRYRQVPFTLR